MVASGRLEKLRFLEDPRVWLTWYHLAALFRFKFFGTYDLHLKVALRLAQRQLDLAEATGTECLSPNHLSRSKIFDEVSQLSLACHSQTGRPTAVIKILRLTGERARARTKTTRGMKYD